MNFQKEGKKTPDSLHKRSHIKEASVQSNILYFQIPIDICKNMHVD